MHVKRQEGQPHPYYFGAMQDVTERVRAEMSARENEAIYKALINSSYDSSI